MSEPAPAEERRRSRSGRPVPALAALLIGAAATSCGGAPEAVPRVVVSVHPVALVVRMVAGDLVPVETFLPAGRNPHDFEPTPSQASLLEGALLFVGVDDHVDPWMSRAARGRPDVPLITMSALGPPGEDRHRWLDVRAAAALVEAVAETLARRDPDRADRYRGNARAAAARIAALERELDQTFADVRDVPFALHHAGFNDLIRIHGLRLVATLQRHTDGEASPQSLGEDVAALRRAGARVIFSQPELPSRLAETAAAEIGGRVVRLDPLGTTLVPPGGDYVAFLEWNAGRMAEALRGARS